MNASKRVSSKRTRGRREADADLEKSKRSYSRRRSFHVNQARPLCLLRHYMKPPPNHREIVSRGVTIYSVACEMQFLQSAYQFDFELFKVAQPCVSCEPLLQSLGHSVNPSLSQSVTQSFPHSVTARAHGITHASIATPAPFLIPLTHLSRQSSPNATNLKRPRRLRQTVSKDMVPVSSEF